MSHVADRCSQLLSCYDNIWIPDDDILADTATINRMFRLFVERCLELLGIELTIPTWLYFHRRAAAA